MRQRVQSQEYGLEISFEELIQDWDYFVEVVKVEPELYRMLNMIGAGLILLVALYTLGKVLLFHKASKSILLAIIPFTGIWTLHKLAWGKGATVFISLIPALGWLFFLLTMIMLCTRFNGGVLSYLLAFIFPPVGLFILGISGKSYVNTMASTVQYTDSNTYNMTYNKNMNRTNTMQNTEYQTQYDDVWGDILKK